MKPDLHKPFTFDRVIRILISAGVLVLVFFLLRYLSDVLLPFAVAVLLAYLINPLVVFLKKKLRTKSRVIPVFLSLFLVVITLTGLGMLIIPLIAREIDHFGQLLQSYLADTGLQQSTIKYLPQDVETFFYNLAEMKEVQAFFNSDNLQNMSETFVSKVLPKLWGLFSGSLDVIFGILGLFIVLLYLVFVLIDYERIVYGWPGLIPHKYRDPAISLVRDVRDAMNKYFRGQALVAGTVGILFAFGFWIIGLPMGFALGIFVGMLNLIPYLQTVGIVPAVFFSLIYAMETGHSFWGMMGLVVLVFAIVQTIQDAVIVPRIMGNVTGLNSAVILLSLMVWGKLLGMLGLIIALPMTTILLSYYDRFIRQMEVEESGIPGQVAKRPEKWRPKEK
jgi:predicted PurR-regulated permease PerM